MYETFLADLGAALPLVLVAVMGIVVVLVDSFRNDAPVIPWLAAGSLVIALVLEVLQVGDPDVAFYGQLYTGGFASYVNAVILLGALGSVLLSAPYLRQTGHNYGEVHALILFATAGMMMLASSASLVSVFVGLETMSICLYVLTGLVREAPRANESALKYFLLGAFSTGFFLYGIALIYGATGTMTLAEMPAAFAVTGREGLLYAGLGLLLIGFFFKVSAVPFHMWTPDVYQGAPTTLTGFMSTTSKASAFAALILVLSVGLPFALGQWYLAVAVVAAVTMVLGNVLAISQSNVKRMLAYSSIAHAGYVLTGIAAGSAEGYSGALYYLLAYTLMNLGAFGVMALLEWDGEQGAEQTLDSLAGVGYRRPVLGVTMGVFMFALTGFPPLAGFIGKYKVFAAAIATGDLLWLAVVGVVASIVSAFYYLRVLVAFWMRDPEEAAAGAREAAFPVSSVAVAVLVFCAVALLGLGVLPGGVLELTDAFFEVRFVAGG
ncbi:MAG: NADH-quinone oxidoreductase subunit N [Rhodothermales bacterium]|nr:NADH-quinone oxidoreductase subunit N [Rhodothermales bacterium]